jgi:hypothetical protein
LVSEVVGAGVGAGVGVGVGVFVSYVNFWKPFEVKSYLAAGMINQPADWAQTAAAAATESALIAAS